MTAFRIAAILLAAGQGRRFGGNKLDAEWNGKPLAYAAATALAAIPFAMKIAVVSAESPDLTTFGFETVTLEPQNAPMSRSIALGVAAAARGRADAVLIALADMPLVPVSHFEAMVAHFDGDRIATHGPSMMPPTIFGERHFASLVDLKGDTGARALLANAPSIDLNLDYTIDIDTAQDLARLRERGEVAYAPVTSVRKTSPGRFSSRW